MQFCDVPAAIPPTMDAILAEARGERLFPGEGGVDLVGLLRAVPRDLPLSLEVPTLTLAKTVGATERARRALAATKRVLAQLDNDSTTSGPSPSRKGDRRGSRRLREGSIMIIKTHEDMAPPRC